LGDVLYYWLPDKYHYYYKKITETATRL